MPIILIFKQITLASLINIENIKFFAIFAYRIAAV